MSWLNENMPPAVLTVTQAVMIGTFAAMLFLFLVVMAQIAEHNRANTYRRVRRAFEKGYLRASIELANKHEDDLEEES